jgi:O-antigen/teichoic acid export membrane protein
MANEELAGHANLILKLSHFLLAPMIAFFAVRGAAFVYVLANGKHLGASPLLFWLSGLLLLQGLHVVLSVIAIAVEDRRAVLIGTAAAMPGILVGMLLVDRMGSLGMVSGLWFSESLWCIATIWSLRKAGFRFSIDWTGWGRLGISATLAALVCSLIAPDRLDLSSLVLSAGILGAAYLAAALMLKPFSAQERAAINRMLPRNLFVF